MRLTILFFIAIFPSLCACSNNCPQQRQNPNALQRQRITPAKIQTEIDDLRRCLGRIDEYHCEKMVTVVNHLRSLGKQQALAALEEYHTKMTNPLASSFPAQLTLVCICRVLFQPAPDGWKAPWSEFNESHDAEIVHGNPRYSKAKIKTVPLYPIILSEGVPFLLSSLSGPNGGAWSPFYTHDESRICLDKCRDLNLIQQDLPVTGYALASIKLVTESRTYANLFRDDENGADFNTLWFASSHILQQALPRE